MSGVKIRRPDDEHLEVYVGRKLVASANYDEHGSSGMDAVERTALAVEKAMHRKLSKLRAQLAELEAEGVNAMADRLVEQTRIRSLEIRAGHSGIDLEPARELVAIWVGVARRMLGDAPNYSETRVDIPVPTDADPQVSMEVKVAEDFERYVFTLQRVGGLTPHEARVRAEAELADLRDRFAALAKVEGFIGESCENASHNISDVLSGAYDPREDCRRDGLDWREPNGETQ